MEYIEDFTFQSSKSKTFLYDSFLSGNGGTDFYGDQTRRSIDYMSPLMKPNFRRARSCDNILDEVSRGSAKIRDHQDIRFHGTFKGELVKQKLKRSQM